jgi:hypothetical protein
MPVEKKYTNASWAVRDKSVPGSNAHETVEYIGLVAIAAADDDGSAYHVFPNVPSSFRPVRCTVQCDAITGGTDFELGVYDTNLGAVVSKGLFMTGQTLATASRTLDGLSAVSLANLGNLRTIAELLSLTPTTAKAAYDIVLTGDTVGTAAGNVRIILEGIAA